MVASSTGKTSEADSTGSQDEPLQTSLDGEGIDQTILDIMAGKNGNAVISGDAMDVMPRLPTGKIAAWITSPPYYGLKEYGHRRGIDDEETYDEYLSNIEEVLRHAHRCSRDDASLWILVDIFKEQGELKLLPFDIAAKAKNVGWRLQDIFIWNKHKALPWSRPGELRNGFEHILLFVKGSRFKFYVDRIRETLDLKPWWVRYPERYNPRGKVPEGIWDFDIPTQGSWSEIHLSHPCPFPLGLVERILLLSTDPGDVVVDPFAGSGAVVAQAAAMKRRAIGIELERKYLADFNHLESLARQVSGDRAGQQPHQKTLERRIWKLRKLKFCREVCRIISNVPGVAHVRLAYVDDMQRSPQSGRQRLHLEFLIREGASTARLERVIEKTVRRPPLSKFQLDVTFAVYDRPWSWPSTKVWMYSRGRFWKCTGEVRGWEEVLPRTTRAKSRTGRWPILVSNIRIDLSTVPTE